MKDRIDSKPTAGPSKNAEIDDALQEIFAFIDNSDDCQFSIQELLEIPKK